ncbi:MAG: glucose-6-phosphate isomerase [Candidatus Muirbacterium halophilum]|nr:glucose-6-phosphate isomerase [Candidatus Muirbacterium halophilum]MCK9474747.1 glucose-6-phosphate isomerase [Candidatus Muirbacterium halophilum]
MSVLFRFENVLSENVGDKGLDYNLILKAAQENMQRCHLALLKKRQNKTLGFFDAPKNTQLCDKINTLVKKYKDKNIKNFVVIGIGGSSLGNITINDAINGKLYNEKKKNTPNIYFADNVDPEKLSDILEIINPSETLFNVITKSGSTAETMSNFMLFYNTLEKACPDKIKENIIITTDREKGNLKIIADKLGIDTFEVPDNIGGRFSVLTAVGLISAAFTGVDINALMKGAEDMEKKCSTDDIEKNPAYMAALIHYLFYIEKNVNINVLMPYSESLGSLSDWFRQLWAESLGKIDKNKKNVGITPAKSLGVIDQHSQVQLYIEGPYDKLITFIEVGKFRKNIVIPEVFSEVEGLSYLSGLSFGKLLTVEKKSTELALTEANRPNATLFVPEVNEYNLGQLFMFFEIMTAFAGELFEIDAFDQPGVESGKIATYAILGKKGFENEGVKIKKMLKNKKTREI